MGADADELHQVLLVIAQENDHGRPASRSVFAETLSLSADRLDELLKRAQERELVGWAGRPIDHTGSPIERSDEGWILLSAGELSLGRSPRDPLDPGPLD